MSSTVSRRSAGKTSGRAAPGNPLERVVLLPGFGAAPEDHSGASCGWGGWGPDLDRFLGSGLGPFLTGADPATLRPYLGHTEVICSDDHPVVPPQYSEDFAASVGASTVVVPGAGHFLASDGVTTLPQVAEALQRAGGAS